MVLSVCNSLSLRYWNIDFIFSRVDGQRTCKLDDSQFQSDVSALDILCLVETHCDPDDTICLPGFQIYQNRKEKTSPKSYSGIAICLKTEISKPIKIMPIKNSEILWMIFS